MEGERIFIAQPLLENDFSGDVKCVKEGDASFSKTLFNGLNALSGYLFLFFFYVLSKVWIFIILYGNSSLLGDIWITYIWVIYKFGWLMKIIDFMWKILLEGKM